MPSWVYHGDPHGFANIGVANFPAVQPVSGTVAVSSFPAVQPVSGTVAVSNLPATQPVSGTVEVGNLPPTQAVSGTVMVGNTSPIAVECTSAGDVCRSTVVEGSASTEASPMYVQLGGAQRANADWLMREIALALVLIVGTVGFWLGWRPGGGGE